MGFPHPPHNVVCGWGGGHDNAQVVYAIMDILRPTPTHSPTHSRTFGGSGLVGVCGSVGLWEGSFIFFTFYLVDFSAGEGGGGLTSILFPVFGAVYYSRQSRRGSINSLRPSDAYMCQ